MLLNFHKTYFFQSSSLSIFIRLLYRSAFCAKTFLHCKGSPLNFHCPQFRYFPLFQLSSPRFFFKINCSLCRAPFQDIYLPLSIQLPSNFAVSRSLKEI